MLDIILLLRSMALNFFSDIRTPLFRFVLWQSGVSGSFTLRSLRSAVVSSWVFLTSSRNWDFSVESVSHFRLAWRARNNPPSSTASDVSAAALVIVPVGTSKNAKLTGVIELASAVHEPLALAPKEPVETPDDDPVEVGKGKIPIPGIELDDDDADADDPLPTELELLNVFEEELEPDALTVVELGPPEPVWLELIVCDPVEDPLVLEIVVLVAVLEALVSELDENVDLDKGELDDALLLKLEDPLLEIED
jgi:hypothetical protein